MNAIEDTYTNTSAIEGGIHSSESLVIIPTYNEAENIESLVQAVLATGRFDVLVVDDNSPDGTGDLADTLARRFPGQVHVIHRPGKRGLSTAYLMGFHFALAAGYEHIFQMDADFSHDPRRLPAMRRALEASDVVLGSRYAPGGGSRNWPLRRRLLSRAGSWYAARMLGLPFADLTGGFKGFRRLALAALDLDGIRSQGYAFQIEMTYACYQRGLRIVETPIVFEDRRAGRSKMNWRIVVEAMLLVAHMRFAKARVLKKTMVESSAEALGRAHS